MRGIIDLIRGGFRRDLSPTSVHGSNDAAFFQPEGTAEPMLRHQGRAAPVIVALPGQIDLTNQERACNQLYAAFACGAAVVIADLTATTFCDASSLRRLVTLQHRAAAHDAQLRLAITPGGPVHRVAELMDLDHLLPVYASPGEAAAAGSLPRLNAPRRTGRTTGGPATAADITSLIWASHQHILCWQARLGQLRQRGGQAPGPGLAATWDTAASLIDLHMRAEDEICGPALYGTGSRGRALARQNEAAHAGIREMIGETSLQPLGSARWWELATLTLAAWARHCDDEKHGPTAECRRRASPALRGQLARQWRAFREARIRDQAYPDAPSELAICQLRRFRPATPHLADPAFSPLACTCQACTDRLDRAFRAW